ncbi:MAG: DUF4091 domain-containing protein [Deltaproteobacteria bacterium]|nr:DUF4091 domain-containing protein [Deltaproteobacteria bacterium]
MRWWFWGVALLWAEVAYAEPPRLAAYPEGVRFDLRTGRFLVPGREGESPDPSRYALPARPLRLTGVGDEVVAFQVVVSGGAGTHSIQWNASPGPDGQPSRVVPTIHDERGIEVDVASASPFVHSLGPGRYPDPLVPTTTVAVPYAQGIAVLWIDLYVPPGTASGVHQANLDVGGTSLPVELKVLDLTLPKEDVARLGAVNFGSVLARWRRGTERPWLQLAHAHLLSVEVLRPVPERNADGEVDWQTWADRFAPYVEGTAFTSSTGYVGPRAGQPIGRAVIPLTDWWPNPATPAGLPSDKAAWSAALRTFEQVVAARGWRTLPNATQWILFINSLDEPKSEGVLQSLAAYRTLIEAAQLQHRDWVWFRVDGNFGQPIDGYDALTQAELLGPVVDLWNVHGAPYTIPFELLEHRRADRKEQVTFYASNSSGEPAVPPLVIDAALTGARAWGWIVARYGWDGALNWEVDLREGCVEQPLCSPGRTMNLDATLIYRGHEVGAAYDRPIASMRLKALRRGAQDAQLLKMLAARDPEAARRLTQLMVPRALGDRVPETGAGAWSIDPFDWDRARNAILDSLNTGDTISFDGVRQDQGPRWWVLQRLWPLGAGAALAVVAVVLGRLWRLRRRFLRPK